MELERVSRLIENFVCVLLMAAPRARRFLLPMVSAVVGLSFCYTPASLGVSESEEVSPVRHDWTIEEIESADRDGLSTWARDICTDLDIEKAAKAINVAPTADAVVAAFTSDLPAGIREDIAKVCFESLPRDPR